MAATFLGQLPVLQAPVLEVHLPAEKDRSISLTATTYRLGRDAANDIVVSSQIVSRFHLVLERTEAGYRVRDLSRNGTFLNGQRIGELELTAPTELEIGPQTNEKIVLVYRPVGSVEMRPASFPPLSLAGRDTVTIGRDAECDLPLNDPSCSRRHATLQRWNDGSWVARDLRSALGTFVNGQAISQAPLARGSVIQCGNTRILFDGEWLLAEDAETGAGMRIDARDLVKKVDSGKVLLDRVTFSIRPGEFVAVLGVSGSGKSTLLGTLNGLKPATSGDLRLNGVRFYEHRDAFRNGIGYVPQDDIIHRELTVEGAVTYAGRLRMPLDTSGEELRQRVTTVLDEVGLKEQRHLPIARLSGGQRKRVSIAVEILTKPPLLLLDEPTSGLDPGLDKQMMTLLARFADEGQTVVLVTHAVGNVDLCDQVIFLANGGRLAFAGNPGETRAYFRTEEFAEIYRTVEAEREPAQWRESFIESSYYEKNVSERLEEAPAGAAAEATTVQRARSAPRRPVWQQFLVLAQRYLEILLRDRGNLAFLLIQAPVVAAMLWLVAESGALTDPKQVFGGRQLVFLMAAAAAWFGIINSVREIVKEASIYEREHNVGVGMLPYIASKFVVLTLLSAVQVGLLLGVSALFISLPSEGGLMGGAPEIYLTLLLTALAGAAMGLALSSLTTSSDRAMSRVPLLLIPQIIFSGFVFKLEGASSALSWLTATRHSVQVLEVTANLAMNALGQHTNNPDRNPEFVLARWAALIALIAVGLLITAVSLRLRDRER